MSTSYSTKYIYPYEFQKITSAQSIIPTLLYFKLNFKRHSKLFFVQNPKIFNQNKYQTYGDESEIVLRGNTYFSIINSQYKYIRNNIHYGDSGNLILVNVIYCEIVDDIDISKDLNEQKGGGRIIDPIDITDMFKLEVELQEKKSNVERIQLKNYNFIKNSPNNY